MLAPLVAGWLVSGASVLVSTCELLTVSDLWSPVLRLQQGRQLPGLSFLRLDVSVQLMRSVRFLTCLGFESLDFRGSFHYLSVWMYASFCACFSGKGVTQQSSQGRLWMRCESAFCSMRSARVGWSPGCPAGRSSPVRWTIYVLAVGGEKAWPSIILKRNRERVGLSRVFSSQVKIDSSYSVQHSAIFDFWN